ncbi:MAG: hypothetical protein P1S60_14980, partial [Anaerolineae bacterium]|nr:hypothetical protein [Anaerolineae bacterium]
YFDPSDQEGCLAALEIALSEGRHSERTRSGLELVKNYSWDKTAHQTLAVYQALGEENHNDYY